MDTHSSFAYRLRRVMKGEKIASFSRRSGISESAIRKYLREGTQPTLDNLIALARTADVSIEWLCTGDIDRAPEAPSPEIIIPREIRANISVIRRYLDQTEDHLRAGDLAEAADRAVTVKVCACFLGDYISRLSDA